MSYVQNRRKVRGCALVKGNVPVLRFSEFSGDWKEKILSDFSYSHKGGASLRPSDFVDFSDYEVVPKKAIIAGGVLNLDKEKPTYSSQEFFEKSQTSQVDDSYLITTLRDLVPTAPSIGLIVYNPHKRKLLLAQGVHAFKLNEKLASEFLVNLSNKESYRRLMYRLSVGSTQVHLRSTEFFKIKLYIPSLPEQQKIATFLSSVDKKLGHLRRKHALLETYKRGVMQKIFPSHRQSSGEPTSSGQVHPELRFKCFDKLSTGKSKVAEPVESSTCAESVEAFPDWEEKRLGDMGKFYGGGTPATIIEKYWNGDIPWVSSSDIADNDIHNISITRFINKEAIKESATKIVSANSILLVSRVGVGKLAVTLIDVCTSQDFSNFTPENDNVHFIAYYLLFNKNKLLSFSQGTSIKGFTTSDISCLKIHLPCKEEQQKIANFLSTLDKKLEAVQKQIDQTETFKKGLLQKMFV